MTTCVTIEKEIQVRRQARGRQELRSGAEPAVAIPDRGRVPRVARLMALALRFDGLLLSGRVRDQAELARLGHVTRARVSQILNLVHLAPDLQEAVLCLEGGSRGADLLLADLQPLAHLTDWAAQRRRWRTLRRHHGARPADARRRAPGSDGDGASPPTNESRTA
jgi:hypothetical protein